MPQGTKHWSTSSHIGLFNVIVSYFEKALAKFHGKVQAEQSYWCFSELSELKVVVKQLCDVSLISFWGNGNI